MNLESNPLKCQELWQKFSPQKHLWDAWEVNYSLYDAERDKFMFMYSDKSLLPLVYNKAEDRHELMGNGYAENRCFWIDDAEIELFFEHLPLNTQLFDMNGASVEAILARHNIPGFTQDYFRYYLKGSTQDYLIRVSRNKRQKLRQLEKKFSDLEFAIEENQLDACIRLNINRFGAESDFHQAAYVASWRKLASLPYIKFLTARREGELLSCSVIGIYQNVLYVLSTGYDTSISDLGNRVTWRCLSLKDELNLTEVDFMAGANDWKANWGFDQEKYYSFSK